MPRARRTVLPAQPCSTAVALVWSALLLALAGCAGGGGPSSPPAERPAEVRARIVSLLPTGVVDRQGWATDIHAAFVTQRLAPDTESVCAVIAVTEQESGFVADPPVPRLGALAREEIDRRTAAAGIPRLLVQGALLLRSPDGRSYGERIDAARTERELSELFESFIASVPLGRTLFGGHNPVRTGGPMQVSIAFAEREAEARPYPYAVRGSLRDEVFTRRGGLYFGIAHLLGYAAPYERPIYRFADFNAGRYASRNAAWQQAVTLASGVPLALDGDLLVPGAPLDRPGSTEAAVRALGPRLGLGEAAIRRALEQGDDASFERTTLYRRVYELAEQAEGRALPRAALPQIQLAGPKISRRLSTEWFARRVDERYRRCLAREA